MKPNKDKTTTLEKGKEYKFVYATSSKGGMNIHDHYFQYRIKIPSSDGAVTLSENAKKMFAAGAALASTAALSYLI